MRTKLSEYVTDLNGFAKKVSNTFLERGWKEMGETKMIGPKEVEEIVALTY